MASNRSFIQTFGLVRGVDAIFNDPQSIKIFDPRSGGPNFMFMFTHIARQFSTAFV